MQRKVLYAGAALIAASVLASCSTSKHAASKKLPGVWQSQPITVDGNSKDWPSPYPEYDSKASLGYAVSNDKDNLYITVETGDLATQLKLLRTGLTVWIDKTGENEQVTAINFPLPHNEKSNRKDNDQVSDDTRPSPGHWQQGQGNGQKQRLNLEDKVRKNMEGANEYSLQGFRHCNSRFPILENDTCGIVVRMAIDENNEMVWEAVVPFKTFYPKSQIDKRDKGKPLSICFETLGVNRPASRAGNGGGGMRPGMGMGMGGMRMGGGMHMGRGMGGGNRNASSNSNAMESLYKDTQTWKKFGIAWQD